MELLTAAQMRSLEAAAIASGEVTGLELMERAGRGVVEAVFAEWPELAARDKEAIIVCGPGNNGGDGFVVARLLKELGWTVHLGYFGDELRQPDDAAENRRRWQAMGGEIYRSWQADIIDDWGGVLIDAGFGIGVRQPYVSPNIIDEVAVVHGPAPKWPRLAIDFPSGVCSDTGRAEEGQVAYADVTVTFHRMKPGHVLMPGAALCGKVLVKDIGLEKTDFQARMATASRAGRGPLPKESIRARVLVSVEKAALKKHNASHKFSHGHALILSGPPSHGGAARLAARGALRIGAGVVTVGCEAAALAEHAARLDAVMLREVAGAEGLAAILADARINALCLGPGLGVDARGAALVAAALVGRHGPGAVRGKHAPYLVLDADALTLISRDAGLFGMLHAGCVLTPHTGEFARLFPDIAARLAEPALKGPAYSKVDACREAAARAGCVVLFKGADTVIAAPDGRCAINAAVYDRAAPWLATAGSGDVLAGFIAGLLARGFAPFEAGCTAAWLHVECARSFGPGLIAEDLAEELPKVFRGLGL